MYPVGVRGLGACGGPTVVRALSTSSTSSPSTRRSTSGFAKWRADTKAIAQHYWTASKLLYKDLWKGMTIANTIVKEQRLPRRNEFMHIVHMRETVWKLLPFTILCALPASTLLIPLAAKYMPDLLPRRFETKEDKERRIHRLHDLRMELAPHVSELLCRITDHRVPSVEEEIPSIAEHLAVPLPVLESHLTRKDLEVCCRYMALSTFGFTIQLQRRLRKQFGIVSMDDRLLWAEGGEESLSEEEVEDACLRRSLCVVNTSPEAQRLDLSTYLMYAPRTHQSTFVMPYSALVLLNQKKNT